MLEKKGTGSEIFKSKKRDNAAQCLKKLCLP